jgi:TolB-like protein
MAYSKISALAPDATFDKRPHSSDNKGNKNISDWLGVEQKDILNSWKEISFYLGRDIKTCQRWEKNLELPVHRYDRDSMRSKVFTNKSEIDEWLENKKRAEAIAQKIPVRYKRVIIGSVGLVILAFSLWATLYLLNTPTTTQSNPSIAVIPFENLNSSGYEDYLSEGLTNDIISSLTRLDNIRVNPVPPNNEPGNPYKNQEGIIGSDYTIKGKLEKKEERLWISVQLIRESDNRSLRTEVYEGTLEEVFLIQKQICEDILDTLNIDRDQDYANAISKGKTQNSLAFDSYLKGSYLLRKADDQSDVPWKLYHEGKYHSGKWTPESNELAINLFHKAIELDSHFALAYIGLAQCYANNVNFRWDVQKKWLDKAEELMKIAQSLAPDLPEYYTTLAEVNILKKLGFNEDTRDKAFELALEGLENYPNHPQMNSIAGYCYFVRYGEEGREADFEKAFEFKEKSFYLNPYGQHNIVFSELLMLKKQFERAEEVCNIIESLDPSSFVKFRLGEIFYYWGNLERSKRIFKQLDSSLHLKIHSLLYLGMIASQRGEKDEALRIVKEIEILKPQDYRDFYDKLRLASIYMGIGEKETGYQYLESIFNNPIIRKDRFIRHKYIEIDKNFDPFREEERLKKILEGENSWLGAKEFQ